MFFINSAVLHFSNYVTKNEIRESIISLLTSSTASDSFKPLHHVGTCLHPHVSFCHSKSAQRWKAENSSFNPIESVYRSDLPLQRCCDDQREEDDGGRSAPDQTECNLSVLSGCVSLTFVLNSCVFVCYWWGGGQRWGQPQTKEDDEVTDMEGSWAAVSGRICVPWKLNQTQDQDSVHQKNKTKNLSFPLNEGLCDVLCCTILTCSLIFWPLLTLEGGPTSWLLRSRAGTAACGSTIHRTGNATSGWSTCRWS